VLGISLGYGPPGVFWAMAIAFSVMSLVSGVLFRRGAWKLKRV
jgi:Na+-driven multidrug efflux pump